MQCKENVETTGSNNNLILFLSFSRKIDGRPATMLQVKVSPSTMLVVVVAVMLIHFLYRGDCSTPAQEQDKHSAR